MEEPEGDAAFVALVVGFGEKAASFRIDLAGLDGEGAEVGVGIGCAAIISEASEASYPLLGANCDSTEVARCTPKNPPAPIDTTASAASSLRDGRTSLPNHRYPPLSTRARWAGVDAIGRDRPRVKRSTRPYAHWLDQLIARCRPT